MLYEGILGSIIRDRNTLYPLKNPTPLGVGVSVLIAIAIILLKRPDKIWKDTLVLIMPVITGIELHRFLSLKPTTFLGTDDAFFWQELNAGPILPKLVILLIIACVMMDIIAVCKPAPIKENTEEENPFK